jgi:hypothetical protein
MNSNRVSQPLSKMSCGSVWATKFCAGLCRVLTRCIALLDTSKKPCRVNRACLQFCFRTRAVLLLLSHHRSVQNWPRTRLFLILIDPVSAGLWPHVRRNTGLTRMQRFGRWIVIRANPGATPVFSRKDLRRILCVIRLARRKRAPEIQSNPLTKNQSGKCSSKAKISLSLTERIRLLVSPAAESS